jgi:hypothetical protein
MDHDVVFALTDRVLKIAKKHPQRLPGKFDWTFYDKEYTRYSIRVAVSAPIFVDGSPEYEIEYHVSKPPLRAPTGTLTVREKGRGTEVWGR